MRDEILAKRAIAGDRAAAESLVAAHYPSVYRFLLHLSGEPDEAKELAQETFLGGWQQLPGYEGRSSLRTWFHRIAYRKFVSRRLMPVEPGLDDDRQDLGQDFVEPLLGAIDLEEAIAGLPEQLRITFLVCQVQELTAREAAEVLGVPIGTVLSRMHHARERLRKALSKDSVIAPVKVDQAGLEGPQPYEMSKAVQ